MRKLSADVHRKAARAATNAAAQVVRKAAKANIKASPSVETGSLHDAVIARRIPPAQTRLTSEHIVTVRGRGKPANKKGQKIARAPHAHFVEFGTVNMPAEPFLGPALKNNQREALDAMADRLRKRIEKAGK
jgi:HK97 gp10 family phage protein